jgi:hypothetical protein
MALAYFRQNLWVKTAQGPAITGAQVWVATQPANVASTPITPLAPIFSDPNGLVPITQPGITDGFGFFAFYALPGLYTIVTAFGGLVQEVLTDTSLGGVGTGGGSGTALVLQVNGAPTSSQLLLNLMGQNSVTVVDAGSGQVNIVGSVFQTNGVTNTLQSKLNLIAGANVNLVADSVGGVTISSSGGGFSGSGAFFYGPGIRDLGVLFGAAWGAPQANSVNGVVTANQVTVYLFQLDVAITVSKASITSLNNSIGPTVSFGIYSYAGNKLVDSGAFLMQNSPLVQTNTFGSVTLQPGTYWHAQACTTTATATFSGIVLQNGATDPVTAYVKNITRCATAANAMSGGSLPATLGALTPFTPSTSDGDGFCAPLYE